MSEPALGQAGITESIADVSNRLGITHRALRFYEQRGLVSPKREGRRRRYTADNVERLETIVKLKGLGFSLADIADVLIYPKDGPMNLGAARCSAQIDNLRNRIAQMNAAIAQLETFLPHYIERPWQLKSEQGG